MNTQKNQKIPKVYSLVWYHCSINFVECAHLELFAVGLSSVSLFGIAVWTSACSVEVSIGQDKGQEPIYIFSSSFFQISLTTFQLYNISAACISTALIRYLKTRAYVKRRGHRRKGVKYGCNSL